MKETPRICGTILVAACAVTGILLSGCTSTQGDQSYSSSHRVPGVGPGKNVRAGLLPHAEPAGVEEVARPADDAPLSETEFADLATELEHAHESARRTVEPDPQAPAKPALGKGYLAVAVREAEFEDLKFESEMAEVIADKPTEVVVAAAASTADIVESAESTGRPVARPEEPGMAEIPASTKSAADDAVQTEDELPVLATGDALKVTLASLKTVVFDATVGGDGNIMLPLVDAVAVGGLTTNDAAAMVRKAYLTAGIYDTRLKVTVTSGSPDSSGDPVVTKSD